MFTFPVAHFGGELSFTIDQSIRFNEDDSAHLDRTPSSASNRNTFTFSAWIKRGRLTSHGNILSAGSNSNDFTFLSFINDKIHFADWNGSYAWQLVSTAVFRDPGAWYNIVAKYDDTQSTASDRVEIYVNGSKITAYDTESYPSQNYGNTEINSTDEHTIGKQTAGSGANDLLDAYMAEIVLVDGTALDASSFGETNSDTGQWVPIDVSGLTFGTNGFHLKGQDSSALGDDSSGNGNDFTSSGLTAADSVLDSPTSNHCTLNPLITPATMTLTDGNLALSGYAGVSSAYGTFGLSSGKWFWQMVAQTNAMAGIAATPNGSQYPGQAADSYAMDLTNGQKYNNGSATTYGSGEISAGDVIGVAFDADGGTLKFFDSDGNDIGTAFSSLTSGPYFPVFRNGNSANISINFGQTGAFTFTPSGYNSLTVLNFADPTIPDPSAHFQTTLYTGNGSTQSITQSGNSQFQPDWVWGKGRSTAESHALFDAVRGTTKIIYSNLTNAEATNSGVTAFNSDGFSIGSSASLNNNTETYAAWQWKANGSGSSNSDGSVSSTVSVNQTAGFSIVKWVHTTSANYTVGHGLGAVPKMVWVKTLDQGTNWGVFHSDITLGNRLILNSTGAQTTGYWGANTFNSTVFSIGSARDANSSNAIGYVFAEVEGYSKISSYVGNGSTDGTFVFTGFKPAWVLLKRTNATQEWQIYDNQRDPFNVANHKLEPNSNSVESILTTDNNLDFLSNGFKLRQGNGGMNASGSNYIYMAFAESPFKTSTAR